MKRGALLLVVMSFWTFQVNSQTMPSNTTIRCRLCNRASTLSDCNKLVTCDSILEECYMDQLRTDQLTVVFEGGCRAKDVCSRSGRKRGDLVLCSRCCAFEEDCNKRLCGIKDDTIGNSQCYKCNHQRADMPCVNLAPCQPNEMCYISQKDVGGRDTFDSGCFSKLVCHSVMALAYENYRVCVLNATVPGPGLTWNERCGDIGKRQTTVCTSCCADTACNYGTCEELRDRLFKMAEVGKFDMKTLKEIP
ncbi:uncharacterized protein LOC123560518 [Mercenaria mercenaria]|uniref:uncharacterized protein LOC123560518 n=1 Tax=Mercenaria mercenaria TaxID=6596 RepID=UPI00234F4ECC|nr:uncharacterized protein LOC123560518 [Mercenaria mercenaria]